VETVSWRTRLTRKSAKDAEIAFHCNRLKEIWGDNRRIARKLNVLGIKTALDLALTNPAFIYHFLSSLSERYRELNEKLPFA
jgi:DNA polymerase V